MDVSGTQICKGLRVPDEELRGPAWTHQAPMHLSVGLPTRWPMPVASILPPEKDISAELLSWGSCLLPHHKPHSSPTRPNVKGVRAMPSLPVEIRDQPIFVPGTQVVQDLLVLAEQADVVGGGEGRSGKARDGFHHLVLVDVDPEVGPMSRVTCDYF